VNEWMVGRKEGGREGGVEEGKGVSRWSINMRAYAYLASPGALEKCLGPNHFLSWL